MYSHMRMWGLASASYLLHEVLVKVQAEDALAPASGDFLVMDNMPFLVQTPDDCLGEQKEYRECNDKSCDTCKPEECKFAEWSEWTYAGHCTGLKKRQRVVQNYGNTCGSVCDGNLVETQPATDDPQYQKHCILQATNATFSEWGEWSACGQDKQRSRTRTANAPTNGGKALNLNGALEELEPCGQNLPLDCKLSEWVPWTTCTKSCNGGRTSRQRHVVQPAAHGGTPCDDTLWENKMCNAHPCVESRDCIMGDWSEWFGCTVGQPLERHRERKIIAHATGNGARCAAGSGPDSAGVLRELSGCAESEKPVECLLSQWNEWQACDRTCDGGQTYRLRHVLADSLNCGSCPAADLKEVKACNVGVPCEKAEPGADCELAPWGEWSACSAKCGKGLTTRERKVSQVAKPTGKGCLNSTKEAKTCEEQSECGKQDCAWGEWDGWSACSLPCGGGSKHRARVIAQSPRNGGKLCTPEDKSEVAACNTASCDTGCQQGLWGEWSDWSECSATCDQGFYSRHRDVIQYPDDCGEPATGPSEEVAICTQPTPCFPPTDCKLSQWSEWSDCTNACKGVKERTRHIDEYASGGGKPCQSDALKEIVPCNPAAGEAAPAGCGVQTVDTPCGFGDWSEWTPCDVTCGGGQTTRTRARSQMASGGGKQCAGSTSEIAPCGTDSCESDCADCEWNDWAEWDDCSKCGGQKRRSRDIKTMPNHCGKPCEAADAQEVTNCTSHCQKDRWCAWADWQQLNPCDATQCGSTKTKQRSLVTHSTKPEGGFLFKAEGIITCSGSEVTLERCPSPESCKSTCEPVNCEWGIWSDWTKPSCEGLCERHRVILKANNECGDPCHGPMVTSKKCDADCSAEQDCELSDWHLWSTCRTTEEGEQRYRQRTVLKYPRNGGKGCSGELSETRPCSREEVAVDCQLSDWSDWLPCTKSCGGGYHIRHRQVDVHAKNGGEACKEEQIHELKPCAEKCCELDKVDCSLSEWSDWESCDSTTGQKYRRRDVATLAQNGGLDCGEVAQGPGQPNMPVNTSLVETQPCAASAPVDCELTEWAKWSECTATCGGGQVQWHRMISTPPANGGKSCAQDWVKIEPCATQPCSVDTPCEVSDWMAWSSCSSSCGEGIRERKRGIKTMATGNGLPCSDALKEVASCSGSASAAECAEAECKWSEWGDWNQCTRTCDGGTMRRSRTPSGPAGGKPCTAEPQEEIKPCHEEPCDAANCKDATWGPWTAWSECSASCDGGSMKRSREQTGKANSCGKALSGPASEIMSCNMHVSCEPSKDCALSEWTAWSACTRYLGFACDGYKERFREMEVATGTGKPCADDVALKELAGCTEPMPDGSDCPNADEKVDCIISDWSEWSGCSVSCGKGHHSRNKTIEVEPQNGGTLCEGSMLEMKECSLPACTVAASAPVDCAWQEWSEWSGCTTCGSQKRRVRSVATWPEDGGKGCEGPSEEIDACNVTCRYVQGDWCMYGDWEAWGSCSASCGPGTKSRSRRLQSTSYEQAQALGVTQLWSHEGVRAKFDSMLSERTSGLEARHTQELGLAFCMGLLSVFLLLGVFRVCGRTAVRREGYDALTSSRPQGYSSSREPLNSVADEEGWSGAPI